MKILSFGEVLWDVYPDTQYIGGAPFNFAAHIAKHGHQSYLCTSVGTDTLGKETLACLDKFGILRDCVSECTEKETGRCLVTLDQNGIPSYRLLSHVAYDVIFPPEKPKTYFDVLYFGTLALRTQTNRDSLQVILNKFQFHDIFVDLNLRAPYYNKDIVSFACSHATILKISDEELPEVLKFLDISKENDFSVIFENLAEQYSDLNLVILTCGSKGAYVYCCKTKQEYFCEAEKVEVISTVGAGDSFSAGFLSRYLEDASMDTCLHHAVKISALVVANQDAVPDYHIKK